MCYERFIDGTFKPVNNASQFVTSLSGRSRKACEENPMCVGMTSQGESYRFNPDAVEPPIYRDEELDVVECP